METKQEATTYRQDGRQVLDEHGAEIAICSGHYQLAKERATFIVRACNAHDELVMAAAKHLEWIDKERQGPVYPKGMSRDSEGGEAIWRKWWNEQLELCADTEALCRDAIAKAGCEP